MYQENGLLDRLKNTIAALMGRPTPESVQLQQANQALQQENARLQLSLANAELDRANRLRDGFLANMSHELRTPLNAVLGISEALQEGVYGPLNENQSRSLGSIRASGQHLLNLINDILDLSKIEAGQLDLEPAWVSVQEVCQASLRFVWQEAHKKELQVATFIDPAVITVWADARRLKQILVNLLSNAVKFTAVGGRIGLEVQGDLAEKTVRFTVWDKGIGIAPEGIQQLFRPFVQLDGRLSREYNGTGLGLSLVYRMTEMLGGQVSLVSEVGSGSQFTIALPWDPASLAGQPADHSLETTAVALTPGSRVILLAEDNEIIIETVSDYLMAKGYSVLVARNGREAIESALAAQPDMILMDVQMPEMDGLQAINRLRAEKATADIPIVALTALAMPGDRERCLAAGANAYLSKPLSLKQLIGMVESLTQA
jgi:signal transduction histidine kinase/CheY-like chemotaxis protein